MKKIYEKLIFLLILALLGAPVDSGTIQMAKQAAEYAWNAFTVANSVHDTYSKFSTPSTTDLMEKTDQIAQSLDNWGGRLEEKIDQSVDLLLTRIPLLTQINEDVLILNDFIGRIEELFDDYLFYLEDPESFDEEELLELIDIFTSRENDDVQGTVAAIHNLIIPQGFRNLKKSLFLLLAEEIQDTAFDLCDTSGSPQQRLAQLYDIIIGTEMKAYQMTIFGYTMEGYMYKTNRISALEMVRDKFIARAKQYALLFKNTAGQAPTVFRQCDPVGGHKRGVTYAEFENFMSHIVVNEVSMTEDGACGYACQDFWLPTVHRRQNPDGQRCEGHIMECSSVYELISYCLGQNRGRLRPEWIDFGGKIYGNNSKNCSSEILENQFSDNDYGQICGVCSCSCAETNDNSSASHFISIREQMADIAENMVVTGIRFLMQNRILYPQVRQGKLVQYTDIPENSSSWVTPDAGIDETKDADVVFTLTAEERRINLDWLTVPKDHAITGVRFQRFHTDGPTQIQFEIHATAFDADSGELDLTTSHWIKPEDMPYAQEDGATRVQYERQEERKDPALSTSTKIDTSPYTFIDIDYTDMDYDVGQTTIPMIDIIPVITEPPTPLVSIGLYHKKQPGYGGFLTFVLEGLNMADYLPTYN